MPAWPRSKAKGGVPTTPSSSKERQGKQEAPTRCLQHLGDTGEMEDLRGASTKKIREAKGEDCAKEQTLELKVAKELSKLMGQQESLQKAITTRATDDFVRKRRGREAPTCIHVVYIVYPVVYHKYYTVHSTQ